MKALFSFLLILAIASGCSEKEIAPENTTTKMGVEDQPPKSDCTGLPNCH